MTKIFQIFLLALFFAGGLHTISCAGVTAANKGNNLEMPQDTILPLNSLKSKFWIVTAMYKI